LLRFTLFGVVLSRLLLLGFIFVGLSALLAWTSPNLMTISHYRPSSGDLAPVIYPSPSLLKQAS
jgi:hypothetical protein